MFPLEDTPHKYQSLAIDIKDYQIIQPIKGDEFGTVYSIVNKNTKKKLAAKVINTNENNPQHRQAINNMIENLICCQHDNVVQFNGYSLKDFDGKDNVTLFIEFAPKGSLADLIQKTKKGLLDETLTNTNLQIILIGIARGMMKLNQHQISHLNLKPESILLNDDLHPIISDFGLSKLYAEKAKSSHTKAPIYTAPEVLEGKSYNGKADVYSFGIIMYELLTMMAPYPELGQKQITVEQFVSKVISENYRPQFKAPIKNSLKKLIEKCWSKDPDERPTFDQLFKKLSYNIDDSLFIIYDDKESKDDNNYYLDEIDVEKVMQYADSIDRLNLSVDEKIAAKLDGLKKEIGSQINEQLKEDNGKLRQKVIELEKVIAGMYEKKDSSNTKETEENSISVDSFNNFSLQLQQTVISKIVSNSQDESYVPFFTKLNNLLQFALKFNPIEKKGYFKLCEKDDNKVLTKMSHEFQIQLLPPLMEMLFSNSSFQDSELTSLLTQFNDVLVTLKYPSDVYNLALKYITQVKQTFSKMKVGVLVTETSKTPNFASNQIINYIKIDSTVSEITGNFRSCTSLLGIEIPNSITSIGASSFECCSLLRKMVIPQSVVSIKSSAFQNCSSLTHILIPHSVTFIGNQAFQNCISLIEIEIPTSVTSIKDGTFNGCSSLNHIELPSSLVSIEKSAFHGCSSLTQVEIPSSCSSIGVSAFNGCSSLTRILMPSSVTSIKDSCFENCSSLTHFEIPNTVTSIGTKSFNGCSSLTKIEIPASVISMGDEVFGNCSSLTRIELSPSLKSIGVNTFISCSSLTHIHVPKSITSIGNNAFDGCYSITKFEIPSSVTCIGDYSFKNCVSLSKIEIPSSVTSIGSGIFYGCSSLVQVILPPSITSIGVSSFLGCSSLSEIEIPTSVTAIGTNAFEKCTSLTKIEIPSDVSSIRQSTFLGCTKLIQVKLPPNISLIEESAFSNCSSLTKIEIPASVISIGKNAFSKCTSLTNVNILASLRALPNGIFSECTALTEIELPSSLLSICDSAFNSCTSLTKVNIPESVASIGASCFNSCTSLTQVDFPSSLTTIGSCAFQSCTSLTQVEIPSSVNFIGNNAFNVCSSLVQFKVPSKIDNVANINLHNSVEIIKY